MLYFEARKSIFWVAHIRHSMWWHIKGTQKVLVPVVRFYCVTDVCTYRDGTWHFHNLKVWTKSYPTSPIAPSNFIPSALWVRLRREQNFRKFWKFSHFRFFRDFENFDDFDRGVQFEPQGARNGIRGRYYHRWIGFCPYFRVVKVPRTVAVCAHTRHTICAHNRHITQAVPHVCHMSSHTVPVVCSSKNDLRASK